MVCSNTSLSFLYGFPILAFHGSRSNKRCMFMGYMFMGYMFIVNSLHQGEDKSPGRNPGAFVLYPSLKAITTQSEIPSLTTQSEIGGKERKLSILLAE